MSQGHVIRGNPGFFDYGTEIALGRVDTRKTVHKFGHNDNIGSAAVEDIWETGGQYVWLQVAVTLEAISNNANDTAAGTGARIITVQGLDANWDEIEENITMNGTSVTSATTTTFIRINRAFIAPGQVGTWSGSNLGVITIRTSGAGDTHCLIDFKHGIGFGQTQIARYSVPRNNTVFVYAAGIWADTNQRATVFWRQRKNGNNTTDFDPFRLIQEYHGIKEFVYFHYKAPQRFEAYTDIIWQAIAEAATAAISVDFEMNQIKDVA